MDVTRKFAPARTPEQRESQLISMAMDAAEEQLRSGKASSQVITHFLKLGAAREALEKEKLENEIALLKAKADAIEASKATEELYRKMIQALQSYRPPADDGVDLDDVEVYHDYG